MQNGSHATARRRTRLATALMALAVVGVAGTTGCDMGQFTVKTTAKVMRRAQPSLKMESDYEMAARAIPASLKTVEGFWVVRPQDSNLQIILTEGYCQYATAFVEDEWERATFKKDLDTAAYHNARAIKMFTRCLNYALMQLGDGWKKDIFEADEIVSKRIDHTGTGKRVPLMWAAVALGSIVKHNLGADTSITQYLGTVKKMMARVIYLDAHGGKPADKALQALPHIALGMLSMAGAMGDKSVMSGARAEFEAATAITGQDKEGHDLYMLPRVLMAYQIGRYTQDRKFFHDQLVKVLETPPNVWPQQRLANEVAHRRARFYLSQEKEIFE